MAGGDFYLGPAGALGLLPAPGRGIEKTRGKRVGVHELLAGGNVTHRMGGRRRYVLKWPALTVEELSVIETLFELPGPYILLDPGRRNLLTANQSTGTDALRSTEGMIARFQGVVTSDITQFRSGVRSIKWDTQGALGATNRGIYFYQSSSVVDDSWAPVRPSTQYTFNLWARADAAMNGYAAIDWHTTAAGYISTSFGTAAALPTASWATRFEVTATSPATAAYAAPALLNSATTAATRNVFADDAMLAEGAAGQAWVLGTGVPRVSLLELPDSSPVVPWESAELVLQEL